MKMPRLFGYLVSKTRGRVTINHAEGTVISAFQVGPVDDGASSPRELKDLENAWAELEAAAEDLSVLRFQGCSRSGQRWQDDPESVRMVAALLRES